MKVNIGIRTLTICLLGLLTITPNTAFGHNIDLPDLGQEASQHMSVSQEKRLGEVIYPMILGDFSIIYDPLINNYIQSLGLKLIKSLKNNKLQYKFIVINNKRINAFAAPGGIIVLNSGLINATKSESELVGVLAHEIAHINLRHHSRMFYENKEFSLTDTITAVATLIAAMHDHASIGSTYFVGQAAKAQRKLNIIREKEVEADLKAFSIMRNAGYNPGAMVNFLNRIKEQNIDQIYEYLSTHPITENRIKYYQNIKNKPVKPSFIYNIIQKRTASLTNYSNFESTKTEEKIYQILNKYSDNFHIGELDKSLDLLIEVEKKLKNNGRLQEEIRVYIELLKAEIFYEKKDYNKALMIISNLYQLYPNNIYIRIILAEIYFKKKNYNEVFSVLAVQNIYEKNIVASTLLSASAHKKNEISLGHEYKAEAEKLKGRYFNALKFYELAKKYNLKGNMIDKRIDAKIRQIHNLQSARDILK